VEQGGSGVNLGVEQGGSGVDSGPALREGRSYASRVSAQ
jgi:hypothetical protein